MPINVTKAPFDDIKVREAVAKAINQEEILASVFGGVGAVADTFPISALPKGHVADRAKIHYDPARANALLDDRLGDGCRWRARQGCLLMLAMAVMLGTLLGDILQAAMDPRVRAALT